MPSGPGASTVWKMAYAEAKKQGYKHFSKGSEALAYVKRIAEMIAAKRGVK